MGHRTYDILTKQDGFDELKQVKIIVIASKPVNIIQSHHLIAKDPDEALTLAKEFKNVIIAGGSILNSAFLKARLVDEIYLDLEPTLFGHGIKLLVDEDFEVNLSLLETKLITKDIIQLHYKVKM